MSVAIAVDGGGSKTDVLAITRSGEVLAQVRGGPSSPQALGAPGAARVIAELIAAAAGEREVSAVGVYLSGLDMPEEHVVFGAEFAAALAAALPGSRPQIRVDNDLFALLRAGTAEADAVAVVCGTGINCVGVRADGATVRYPALGAISGDWGGGAHLGEQALWHAARAADGRGPATVLQGGIPDAFGLQSLAEVIEALHFGRLGPARLAELSPVVFAAAEQGDAVASSLLDRQAEEIVLFAASALRRLDLLGREVPVVLGGGLIRARNPRLMAGIERGLAAAAPLARAVVVDRPPVLGAALLVLDGLGAADAALTQLAAAVA